MNLVLSNNHDLGRYEAHLDDELAGLLAYSLEEDALVLLHTVVHSWAEGRGIGSALAKHGLEDARDRLGLPVRPVCTFVQGYIEQHPDYAGLVAAGS